jgi:acyl carrier protein
MFISMTQSEFINKLQDELELETPINNSTIFKNLEEWDSLSAMILIGFVSEKFNVIMTGNDIEKLTDVQSLIYFIGVEKFD